MIRSWSRCLCIVLRIRRTAKLRQFTAHCLAGLLFASVAESHEPVFSVGPETIFQGGVGIEAGPSFESAGSDQNYAVDYELLYGVTSRVSLTLAVPQILRSEAAGQSESGLGDVALRVKYRFWTRNRLNAATKAALILGVKAPTARHGGAVPLGSGSTDPLFGLSLGHESRTWYGFGTLRYLLRTKHEGVELGDRILYDVAAGYRPWRRDYLEWDFVFLLEYNGETTLRDRAGGSSLQTGGDVGWLGPTTLIYYRNLMTKFGVQVPLYRDLRRRQPNPDVRALVSFEYHF